MLMPGCKQTAYELKPQALVERNVITSNGFPHGRITIDSSFTYVGTELFVLYDVASCEIHLFVEADNAKRVRRFYWVQFELYLPDNSKTYDYSPETLRVAISGYKSYVSQRAFNLEQSRSKWRRGSDVLAVYQLLERKGYSVGPELMRVRFGHLDSLARNELMIIYTESLDVYGVSSDDISERGKGGKQGEHDSARSICSRIGRHQV